jgi:hypothetical protein
MSAAPVNKPIVHFVGSIPLPDAETVFRTLATATGPHLKRVPDGETGIRKTWIRFLQQVALHKNSRFLVKGQSFRAGKNYSRELPAPIHNRTPVILPATAWRLWFGEEKRSPTNPSASSDYVQRN